MTKRLFQLNTITVENAKLNKDVGNDEDVDSGTSDGSGNFSVSANSAKQSGKNVVFSGIEITAESPDGKFGYADWDDSSLIEEAEQQLRDNYCH